MSSVLGPLFDMFIKYNVTIYILKFKICSQHAQILWWVLLLKIVDFTETVMFVLRKKNKQISTLHVYHHVSSMILTWISVKYLAGEMATFITLINCSVHVIMYIYYLLAVFGSHVQAIIMPVKPYITILQMASIIVIA